MVKIPIIFLTAEKKLNVSSTAAEVRCGLTLRDLTIILTTGIIATASTSHLLNGLWRA